MQLTDDLVRRTGPSAGAGHADRAEVPQVGSVPVIDEDDVHTADGDGETLTRSDGEDDSPSATDRPGGAVSRRERRRQKREERWTRPVVHDWRWYVQLVGRSLIVIGLLMFGFVAYQLWGTGLETARAQDRLEREFEERLAEAQESETASADDGSAADPDAGGPGSGDGASGDRDGGQGRDDGPQDQDGGGQQGDGQQDDGQQGGAQQQPDGEGPGGGQAGGDSASGEDGTSEPSGRTETVQIGDGPIRRELPPLAPGSAFGKIEIPEIGLDFMTVEGVTPGDLKNGIGHYPDTPQPGELGNAALAGHRTTYGDPLLHADQLAEGDRIILTTFAGTFVYDVTESFVVGPSDSWVVQTEDEEVATLTMTTCHPAWTARERLVVRAELDPNASDEVFIADPAEETADDGGTSGGGDGQSGDDDTAEVDDPVVAGGDGDGDAGDGSGEPGEGATTGAGEAGEGGEGGGAPDADEFVPSEGGVDAFEQGWFSDSGAWPHVAAWTLLLAALGTAGYFISRFFRRYWVGTAVCALPFFVTLFFFYQNVNRLLPPAL